uniref:tryptophan--tRNA ligase n=1 Tax=Peronospora matthiolae TaxID=2874970 RepID=A0AAV1UET9_9STRA
MTSPRRSSKHLPLMCRRRRDVVRVPSPRSTSTRPLQPQSRPRTTIDDVRVFSGIQPSGVPHLGNYCGAIAKWVQLQHSTNDTSSLSSRVSTNDTSSSSFFSTNDTSLSSRVSTTDTSLSSFFSTNDTSLSSVTSTSSGYKSPVAATVSSLPCASPLTRLFSVVDLHALTVPFDATHLTSRVYTTVAALLGAGIDAQRSIVFRQSHVAAHSELAWLLSCVTPLTWLHRMTQFKQKSKSRTWQEATASPRAESSLGLLSYPVLMAADILLYRATLVPVGDDQLQHLELARMIATTFNTRFGRDDGRKKMEMTRSRHRPVLLKPLPMRDEDDSSGDPGKSLVRIMSLRDPTVKMSKSDASVMSRIELTDSADEIRKKIRKATTDAVRGIHYDRKERPGVSNLLDIASAVTGQSVMQLEAQYADYGTGAFKDSVADAVIARICPIGERIKQYEADLEYLDKVLADGAARASELAAVTMKDVKEVMGLVKS